MSRIDTQALDQLTAMVSGNPADNVKNLQESNKREIKCPAGEAFYKMGTYKSCHCRINDTTVTPTDDPLSYKTYCTDAYESCPVWVVAKEIERNSKG